MTYLHMKSVAKRCGIKLILGTSDNRGEVGFHMEGSSNITLTDLELGLESAVYRGFSTVYMHMDSQ